MNIVTFLKFPEKTRSANGDGGRDEIGEDEDEGLGRNFLVAIFWKNKRDDDERSNRI